jgi:hypothetical protein
MVIYRQCLSVCFEVVRGWALGPMPHLGRLEACSNSHDRHCSCPGTTSCLYFVGGHEQGRRGNGGRCCTRSPVLCPTSSPAQTRNTNERWATVWFCIYASMRVYASMRLCVYACVTSIQVHSYQWISILLHEKNDSRRLTRMEPKMRLTTMKVIQGMVLTGKMTFSLLTKNMKSSQVRYAICSTGGRALVRWYGKHIMDQTWYYQILYPQRMAHSSVVRPILRTESGTDSVGLGGQLHFSQSIGPKRKVPRQREWFLTKSTMGPPSPPSKNETHIQLRRGKQASRVMADTPQSRR